MTRPRSQQVLPGILGKQLRAAYGELLNAAIPDTITQLIKKLEASELEDKGAACSGEKTEPRDEESGQ